MLIIIHPFVCVLHDKVGPVMQTGQANGAFFFSSSFHCETWCYIIVKLGFTVKLIMTTDTLDYKQELFI